jgi:hypothetical protein
MRARVVLVVLALAAMPANVRAFGIEAHRKLTREALRGSMLVTDTELLEGLGLCPWMTRARSFHP